MQRIGRETEAGEQMYHTTDKLETGEAWTSYSGKTYMVTNHGQGDAVDMDGIVNKGWYYTLREATAEELAQIEQERAEWNAKTSEERIESQFSSMAEAWGNR